MCLGKTYWDIPGGYVELGESLGRLGAPRHGRGGLLDDELLAAIEFADGEISEYKFVAAEHLDQFTVPRLVNRLRSSLEAKFGAHLAYLEGGVRP